MYDGPHFLGVVGFTYGSDVQRAHLERAMAQSTKHAIHTLHWTGALIQR